MRAYWRSLLPFFSTLLEELLQTLHARGIMLGVVTNGGVLIQRTKIEHMGIGRYLSAIIISEAVQVSKPDIAIFAHALAEMNCSPTEAWFVGDHPVNDVLGATAAGLRAIWLPALHSWPQEHPRPACQIESLLDLLLLLQPAAS